MSNKLTGINPLSYVGVNATTPPQLLTSKVNPTDKDFYNYSLGTQWLNEQTQELWVLLDVAPKHTDRWGRIYPEASGGTSYFVTESGTATSISSVINIVGGNNIVTAGVSDIVTIDLADDISISGTATFESLTGGLVRTDSSGELSSIADPTTNGKVLISSATGVPAWANITAGANVSITNGANSITIAAGGGGSGSLTFAGDTGTATADAGSMAINGDGTTLSTVASGTGATAKLVVSLASSPTFTALTTSALTLDGFSEGVLSCDGSGLVSSSAGSDGQVLIGATGGVPEWNELYEGANVYINNDAHGITVGTSMAIKGDTGEEDIYASLFEVLGDSGNITTAVGLDDTTPKVTITMSDSPTFTGTLTAGTTHTGDITVTNQGAGVAFFDENGTLTASDPSAKGKVIISSSTGAPDWANLTAGANISITNGDGSITIAAGGGSGGDLTFTADGGSVTADTGTIALVGDSGNITTTASGSGATAKVTVAMSTTPDFSDVSTINLEVSGQPTFTNIGGGLISSTSGGTLSSLAPTANGQVLIGASDNSYSWHTLTAGAGITVTNTANAISLSTSAATTFTGTSGSATTAGSLKIIGDLGNITTTASGTGASAQVVVAIAASPTFTTVNATTVSTATLTASGTVTLSGLTAGLVKSSSAGVISKTAPTADGQVLIGAADGSMSWATLTQGTNVTITNGANSITVAASGGGGSSLTFAADSGTATPSADTITFTGGTNIQTSATGAVVTLASTAVDILAKTANYTLALADAGYLVTMTSSSGTTLTIPTNTSVAFPTGTTIQILRGGTGSVTVSPASGVTLHSAGSYTTLYAQYSMAYLVKTATNTWILSGDIG